MKPGAPVPTLWAALLASWLAGATPPAAQDARLDRETKARVDYASSASLRTASR